MNSLSVALTAGYLSVRTADGASEKQSSLKARLRNGLTYLLTWAPLDFFRGGQIIGSGEQVPQPGPGGAPVGVWERRPQKLTTYFEIMHKYFVYTETV